MRKIILLLTISMLTIVSVGCVKKKNCDCGLEGWMVTYDKPIYCDATDSDIFAKFYPDDGGLLFFYKSIQYKYRKNDSIYVSICFTGTNEFIYGNVSPILKLTCIEQITE